ncbi:HNH endonuclease [Sporomusa termitida]|uniref:HNH domain-containing protein n=1 Tax=Sporomusa termitida TaxID=2377 RepID=A0A517DVC9_9FIRM|nr:HNH endonuclease [Sporomusa termitida]QDR81319.1 hypothetical protein SPTER_26970 [Sporomusa termitida]
MKNLSPLADNCCYNYFSDIMQAKRKPEVKSALLVLAPDIQNRYQDYIQNKMDLSVVNSVVYNQTDKSALLNCYESTTKPLAALKTKILEAQNPTLRGKCQYCGINAPTTFDHYMPKDTFPEYSVMPINLIPCCFECNNIRNDNWLTSSNHRGTINLYYENLPTDRYLSTIVVYSDDVPVANFNIFNPGTINSTLFTIVLSHFEILKLKNRYKVQTASVASEIKRSIVAHNHPPISGHDISQWLIEEANSKRQEFGENYWEAAFIEGLATCDDFINQCIIEINNK